MTTASDAGRDATAAWLRALVREVPDFPDPGVRFRDITPLLASGERFHDAVDALAERFAGETVDRVVGVESRGFIFAAPIAYRLAASFIPVRKAGKLPWAVVREEYSLEYGRDKLEIHRDAIHPDDRVLVIDDVLATGGTAEATVRLVEALGGAVVGFGAVLEVDGLGGRDRLSGQRVEVLASY
ncbi:MAG: adenine phosphoribosyltransferase [Desertimonas sp.]